MKRNDPLTGQRERLGLWLAEWVGEQRLRAGEGINSTPARGPVHGGAVNPASGLVKSGKLPAVGEVWLLAPLNVGDCAERPLFGLVVEMNAGREVVWIPFSRFRHPAVPGEWSTGLRARPLQVLCVWNAQVLQVGILLAGWRAGRVGARVVTGARMIRAWLGKGGAVPPHGIGKALGPPLRHPLDPRHGYLEEESRLVHAGTRPVGLAVHESNRVEYPGPDPALARAAESRITYGVKKPSGGKRNPGRRPKRRTGGVE